MSQGGFRCEGASLHSNVIDERKMDHKLAQTDPTSVRADGHSESG